MSATKVAAQTASISISLMASGGIAALSLFDIPELQAQPASRSLPSIRWLFSRGSHIFPSAVALAAGGFTYLAVTALPQGRAVSQIIRLGSNGFTSNSYLAAAALNLGVGFWTSLAMIPTNFALIEENEKKGGARSEKSAKESQFSKSGDRTAEESVNSKGDVSQWTDLSNPQEKARDSTPEEDEKVRDLIGKFGRLNWARAVFAGAGGVVGLVAALS